MQTRGLPSLIMFVGGITLLFYECFLDHMMYPELVVLAASMIGITSVFAPLSKPPVEFEIDPDELFHVTEWQRAINRYMAGEIDDFDLDLEGDYILRGLQRPKIVSERKKLGPTPGHWSWCTCEECVGPRFTEIERAITDQFGVPPMMKGAKYAERLGESLFDEPYPIQVVGPSPKGQPPW